jgi:hypothetical protein
MSACERSESGAGARTKKRRSQKKTAINEHGLKMPGGAEPSSALKTAGAAAGENSSAPTLPAAFFCPHPKKSRRPLQDSKERKIFHKTTVRKEGKMERSKDLQTLLMIIPNTVHGCKKLDIGRL